MKKTMIFLSVAMATVFTFSSSQKEYIESNVSESGIRVITAEFENNATKTTLNSDGKTPEWAVGDVIRVLSSSTYKDITLVSGNGTPEEGQGIIAPALGRREVIFEKSSLKKKFRSDSEGNY